MSYITEHLATGLLCTIQILDKFGIQVSNVIVKYAWTKDLDFLRGVFFFFKGYISSKQQSIAELRGSNNLHTGTHCFRTISVVELYIIQTSTIVCFLIISNIFVVILYNMLNCIHTHPHSYVCHKEVDKAKAKNWVWLLLKRIQRNKLFWLFCSASF